MAFRRLVAQELLIVELECLAQLAFRPWWPSFEQLPSSYEELQEGISIVRAVAEWPVVRGFLVIVETKSMAWLELKALLVSPFSFLLPPPYVVGSFLLRLLGQMDHSSLDHAIRTGKVFMVCYCQHSWASHFYFTLHFSLIQKVVLFLVSCTLQVCS